jgi:hypothetical protein
MTPTATLAQVTANGELIHPNGARCWLLSIALGVALFLGARAWDTYRHRLARDRALADAYRKAQAPGHAQTTTSTARSTWQVSTTPTSTPVSRPRPATTATGPGRPAGIGPRLSQVEDIVRKQPGLRTTDVALATGLSSGRASRLLYRLAELERVHKVGAGWQPTQGSEVSR